ncbi:MAG: glycerophosphodiester phosphodiesterase [Crocinitomicaceae bacterium]|nr:glycerophosphodiester phosphodiesterase [Crocinitomicaceae bacterium]
MKGFIFLFSFFLFAFDNTICQTTKQIDWQGHRGARGLFPENSIYGFENALNYPINTLEFDVVISKDNQIVVSHEPWFSDEICDKPLFENNIYKLNLSQIQSVECGVKDHKRFLDQQKVSVSKPTLKEVILAVNKKCESANINNIRYNIELKSKLDWSGVFVPFPDVFSALVLKEIKALGIESQLTLQSFDTRILEELHKMDDKIKLVLLTNNSKSIKKNLKKISFKPFAYSPNYKTLRSCQVKKLHKLNIKVIPWTVNSKSAIKKVIKKGVDGVITDYPNLIHEF